MTVSVGLRVGQNFVGDPVPRYGAYIERFVVKQGRTEEPIDGMNATDPAGWFTANGRAAAVIAYASKPSFVELPAAKFEDYLRQQGLERIVAARARRGERAKPGREIFSRCAKAILTGARASIAVTQPLAGVWLIKSVQMIDAPRGSNAEWESLWASLTFDAPPAEGRP